MEDPVALSFRKTLRVLCARSVCEIWREKTAKRVGYYSIVARVTNQLRKKKNKREGEREEGRERARKVEIGKREGAREKERKREGAKKRNRGCLIEVLPSAAGTVLGSPSVLLPFPSEQRLTDKQSSLAVTLAPTGGTAPPRGNYPAPLQALIPPPLNKTPFHIQNPEDGVVLISLGDDCYCSSPQKCPFWHGSAPIQPVWFKSKPRAYCTSSYIFFLSLSPLLCKLLSF